MSPTIFEHVKNLRPFWRLGHGRPFTNKQATGSAPGGDRPIASCRLKDRHSRTGPLVGQAQIAIMIEGIDSKK